MKYKYWTKDRCFEEVKKYNSKKEFIKNAPGAFTALRRNGWIKEVWGNYENLKGNLKNRCVYTYEFSLFTSFSILLLSFSSAFSSFNSFIVSILFFISYIINLYFKYTLYPFYKTIL